MLGFSNRKVNPIMDFVVTESKFSLLKIKLEDQETKLEQLLEF